MPQQAPVKMTRAEYQAKFGTAPAATPAPVQMTRAEYQAKYGAPPQSTVNAPQQPAPEQPDYLHPFVQVAQGHPLAGLVSAAKLGAQGIMSAPGDIASAFTGGLQRGTEGMRQIQPGAGPMAGLEGGLKVGSGIASMVTSPLAPLMKPIGGAIDQLRGKVEDIPAYQKVARSLPNIDYNKYSSMAGDVSNIAGTIAGADQLVKTGANIKAKVQDTATNKAVNSVADAYRETAGQTIKANKTLNKSVARGNDPAQWLAERNMTPTIKEGEMHTNDLQTKITQDAAPMNEHLNVALREVQTGVPRPKLEDVRAKALSDASKAPNLTETARAALTKHINDEFDLLKTKHGGEIDLESLNRVKQANWAATPFDSTKPYQGQANYLIGKAAKETVEKTVPKDAVPVHELNAEIGKMYDARKFLSSLDGKAVKGGRLGKYFARTIGATIGHGMGGTVGAITGAFGGDMVSNLLQSTTFSNPLKQMLLKNLAVKDPAAYQQALKFIGDSQAARATRLALPPAGGTSPGAIELPSPGVLKGQQAINGGRSSPPPSLPQGPGAHPILGSSPKILQQAPKEATTASLPSRLGKLASSIKNTIGDERGMIRNPLAPAPKSTPLARIHPEDRTLLQKAADRIDSGTSLGRSDWESVQKMLASYSMETPKTQAAFADWFNTVNESHLGTELTSSLKKSPLVNASKVNLKKPVQPRQQNGWWGSFKK